MNETTESKEDNTSLEIEEVMNELPEIEDVVPISSPVEERLKVISVEPIETAANDAVENPYIIADYKDDDYVDVNSLFDSNGVL